MVEPHKSWQVQQRPPLMTRRYDFASYGETRKFLDDSARLSDQTGYFPDLNFGKTYVNVSVAPRIGVQPYGCRMVGRKRLVAVDGFYNLFGHICVGISFG